LKGGTKESLALLPLARNSPFSADTIRETERKAKKMGGKKGDRETSERAKAFGCIVFPVEAWQKKKV